jgi:hypothetical protein
MDSILSIGGDEMSRLTKRAQVLLTPEEYKVLVARANGRKISVGEVIREAIRREIISEEQRRKRRTAVRELISGKFALSGPPFDHVQWKKEYPEYIAREVMHATAAERKAP